MKMHFITYGTNSYTSFAHSLADQATSPLGNFASKKVYNKSDISLEFKQKNASILSCNRGDGYWLWKPFIILEALLSAKPNEIVVYCDSMYCMLPGNVMYTFCKDYFDHDGDRDILLTHNKPGGSKYLETDYTKSETFEIMNMRHAHVSPIKHKSFQVWAGFIALRRTNRSIRFICEWLSSCQIEKNINDDKSVSSNQCIDHRHDQSILSLLAKHHGIEFYDFPNDALIDMYVSPPRVLAKQTLYIKGCANGLGDRILDVIGSMLVAKYTNSYVEHIWHNKQANIYFNNSILSRQYELSESADFKIERWGCMGSMGYMSVSSSEGTKELVSPNSAYSLSPVGLSQGILKHVPLSTIAKDFKEMCNTLIFAPRAIDDVLTNSRIGEAIGIHLRRTDKIVDMVDSTNVECVTSKNKYDSMMTNMSSYIAKTAPGQLFFICTDDPKYLPIFKAEIMNLNSTAEFVSFDSLEQTVQSVPAFDLFALSRCRQIFQATLYSSFSLTASLIGNIPIVNFMYHESVSMIHLWKSCNVFVTPFCDLKDIIPIMNATKVAYIQTVPVPTSMPFMPLRKAIL